MFDCQSETKMEETLSRKLKEATYSKTKFLVFKQEKKRKKD